MPYESTTLQDLQRDVMGDPQVRGRPEPGPDCCPVCRCVSIRRRHRTTLHILCSVQPLQCRVCDHEWLCFRFSAILYLEAAVVALLVAQTVVILDR